MAEYLGLSWYEHAPDRPDYRNGSYLRHLLSELGDIEVLVPRGRKAKFRPQVCESQPGRRDDNVCLQANQLLYQATELGQFRFRRIYSQWRYYFPAT